MGLHPDSWCDGFFRCCVGSFGGTAQRPSVGYRLRLSGLFHSEEMVRMGIQRTMWRPAGMALAAVGLASAGAGLGAAVAAVLIQRATDPTAEYSAGLGLERSRTQPGG